jgi:hypothetical protein
MLRIRGKYNILINRPRDEVFRFIATDLLQNRRSWTTEVLELEKTSDGPMGVGTTWRERVKDRWGREGEVNHTVTEYEPDEAFAFEAIATASGQGDSATSILLVGRYTIRQTIGGSRVTFVYSYDLPLTGLARLGLPLWSMQMKQQSMERAERLRKLLEAQE